MKSISLKQDVALGVTVPSRHARGRAARIGPALDVILANHGYPPVIEQLLAEALVLTALLGSLLKDPSGQLTIQAQTENGIVDLERRERFQPIFVMLLTHRCPGVGDDHLGPLDRLQWIFREENAVAGARHRAHSRVRLEPVGRRHRQLEMHQRRRLDQRVADIVAVAEPCPARSRQLGAMLDHRLHVGQDLARVRQVGQAVDHRHGGILCQLLHLPVMVGADHDRIGEARQDARGVGDGLAAPKLRIAAVEHDRGAAQLAHRQVEAHSGARRVFLEDHRQHRAVQRLVRVRLALGRAGAFFLPLHRLTQNMGDGFPARVGQVEEVARHAASGTS